MKNIERKNYMNTFIESRYKNLIKVLTIAVAGNLL